jgi:hypothetical protein
MKPRMLCTDCFRTAEPDTLLEGSDRVEMLAWCCFAVPGWLYCWWRHALRIKLCPFCGGGELVREARAAAARSPRQAPPSDGPRILPSSPGPRWPRALATPRDRLRHGGVMASLAGAWIAIASLASLDLTAQAVAAATTHAVALACTVWIAYQAVRVSQRRARLPGCRAWDASGRPLHIERIS